MADVIAQPALLLGSGLSCNYSVAVASRRPDLCRGIIGLSPRTLFSEAGRGLEPGIPRWLALLIGHPLTALPFYSLFTTRPILRIIVAWPYASKNASSDTVDHVQVSSEELASIFANAHQFGAEHAALAWMVGKLNLDVLPQFEQLTLPVLTIWSRHALDAISATIGQPAHLHKEKRVVMEAAEPGIHTEQSAQVAADIVAWQAELEPATIATGAGQHFLNNSEASSSTLIPGVQPEDTVSVDTPPITEQGGQLPSEPVNETQPELGNVVDEEGDATAVEVLPSQQEEAYCVRCKQKRTMRDPHKIVTKNGRSALEGTCPVCGVRLFRFIKG